MLPASISWMKLTYEICTGDELPPHAPSTSATSTATARAARRIGASPEDLLRVVVIVAEVNYALGYVDKSLPAHFLAKLALARQIRVPQPDGCSSQAFSRRERPG